MNDFGFVTSYITSCHPVGPDVWPRDEWTNRMSLKLKVPLNYFWILQKYSQTGVSITFCLVFFETYRRVTVAKRLLPKLCPPLFTMHRVGQQFDRSIHRSIDVWCEKRLIPIFFLFKTKFSLIFPYSPSRSLCHFLIQTNHKCKPRQLHHYLLSNHKKEHMTWTGT